MEKKLPVLTEEEADAAIASLNKQILDHFLEIDHRGMFKNPPKTDDQLHLFIKLAFGVDIPRKAVIPGHSAPFQFLSDLFFERVKNAVAFANRSGGKRLSVLTPILTATRGWTTFGDLTTEDYVFAVDGSPAKVTQVTEILDNTECFKITFDCGETVIADAGHVWVAQRAKQSERNWTTKEMFEVLQDPPKVGYGNLFSIRTPDPLQFTAKELPVHPYVLGAWLGDGTSTSSGFECWDAEIMWKIREHWTSVSDRKPRAGRNFVHSYCLTGLFTSLRDECGLEEIRTGKANVAKLKKRIPKQYQEGSVEQRLELLRGIMDTDGHFQKSRTRCEISTIELDLATDIMELLRGLGFIPRLYDRGFGKYMLNGTRHTTKNKVYRVTFGIAPWSPNPFFLPRKAEAVTATSRAYRHKITSIVPVESVPVRCIAIDHPSHLYLFGKALIPTHNTYNVAILNFLDMLFKPTCEIAHGGATRVQAKACYKYFLSFLELPWFKDFCKRYVEITGKEKFVVKENQDEAEFANNATQTIIVSSEKGLRSPHPQKARLDEVDLIDWEILLTGLSMARSSQDRKIKGQNVFTSTRQNEYGSMQRLLDDADAKGIKVYEWNIWDVVEKCPRQCENDPEFGTCPIFTYCGGRAHEAEGFYPIEDFIDKARIMDRERFEIEWENKKPSRAQMVFPMLDPTRHLMTPQMLYQQTGFFKPQPWWQVVSGLDFGGSPGHPFVYLKFCQLPTGAWLCFWEHMDETMLIRERAKIIKGSPFWKPSEAIYSDWNAQDRKELAALGVRLMLANKDFDMSLDYVRSLFRGLPPKETPLLYWWNGDIEGFPPCKQSWQEINKYLYPVGQDGKPVSDRPKKVYDNACFTGATEVLTERGWISLANVTEEDTVLVVDEVGVGKWERPISVIHQTYSGKMWKLRHRGIEFDATDNHMHAVISQYDWKVKHRVRLAKMLAEDLASESYWLCAVTAEEGPGAFFQGADAAYIQRFKVASVAKSDFTTYEVTELPVHCVETSTGMFLARTNGKPFVAGNSDASRYGLYTWKVRGSGSQYRTRHVDGL